MEEKPRYETSQGRFIQEWEWDGGGRGEGAGFISLGADWEMRTNLSFAILADSSLGKDAWWGTRTEDRGADRGRGRVAQSKGTDRGRGRVARSKGSSHCLMFQESVRVYVIEKRESLCNESKLFQGNEA